MNLINLRGWPKPAGWNSGRPVGSVVPIRSAPAPQWFIYLIGMNSKDSVFSLSLFSPPLRGPRFTTVNTHTLCWMSCLSSSKRKKKPTCQNSSVGSGLTFEMLTPPILYRLLDASTRRSDDWCATSSLSLPFSSHMIHSGSRRGGAHPSAHRDEDVPLMLSSYHAKPTWLPFCQVTKLISRFFSWNHYSSHSFRQQVVFWVKLKRNLVPALVKLLMCDGHVCSFWCH